MSTQYPLVQSGKTASGGCSAGQGSSEPVAPRNISLVQGLSNCGTRTTSGTPATVQWFTGLEEKSKYKKIVSSISSVTEKK
jgi:hypothetical protein